MNETAEVYLGATAEIRCNYEFTNVAKEPSFVMIQWFVVSFLWELPHKKVIHVRTAQLHVLLIIFSQFRNQFIIVGSKFDMQSQCCEGVNIVL